MKEKIVVGAKIQDSLMNGESLLGKQYDFTKNTKVVSFRKKSIVLANDAERNIKKFYKLYKKHGFLSAVNNM